MRRIAVALGLLIVMGLATPVGAITNGSATAGRQAFAAALLVGFARDDEGALRAVDADSPAIVTWAEVCSGALIAPQRVATAGHCAMGIPGEFGVSVIGVSFADDLSRLGRFDPELGAMLRVEEGSERPLPATLRAIPNFDAGAVPAGDLGIAELRAPVVGIAPVEVASLGYLDGLRRRGRLMRATFTAVGYGSTRSPEDAAVPEGPSWDPLRKMGTGGYSRLGRASLTVKRTRALGMAGPCFGDSGGPVLHTAGGRTVLVGVISTGDGSCRSTTGTARVDVARARQFLLGP